MTELELLSEVVRIVDDTEQKIDICRMNKLPANGIAVDGMGKLKRLLKEYDPED